MSDVRVNQGTPTLEQLAAQIVQEPAGKFRTIFESSSDALFLLTEDGFFDCNPRAMEIFCIPSRAMITTIHPSDISAPLQPDGRKSREAALVHIARALEQGTDSFEWMHRRLDGTDFFADVLLSAIDFGGRRVLQATVRDITPQKIAEAALREKTEELDRFFNIALDLLCIADTDGYFRRLNHEWESTLGYTLGELQGRQFLELVHPEDVQTTLDAIATLSTQKPVIGFANRYRCKDGSYRWIEWRSAPSGRMIYAAARDITPHIEARERLKELNESLDHRVRERTAQLEQREADLRQLNAELEQRVQERTALLEAANRELEAFSYSVSHDLRAPLRHISGFVDLLLRDTAGTLDEKGRRWLGLVADASKEMAQLIEDLLVFSRMGRTEMMRTDCDLRSIVLEAVQRVSGDVHDRDVEWSISELPVVHGDPSMLRLAMLNLIGNAFKYTRGRSPARIEVISSENDREWIVAVKDNGVGFEMKYADKLFGVFQRLHSAKDYEGTGIGLANVQRIIHRHGGRVWAEGELNKGAVFYFSLPKRTENKDNENHSFENQQRTS
ncbi:MAG: PAS domain S-box protein [Bacteroidia bacterium]|nr:PAS domain S-box protein [Bacteroidia bacterium]